MLQAIFYLLAITSAEILTIMVFPLWGIIAHTFLFLALIVHWAVDVQNPRRPLFLSLALAPLTRIVSLSMPLAGIPQIWWYPLIYAPLLLATIAIMRLLNQERKQVGLTLRHFPTQMAVAFAGIPLGAAEYFILRPEAVVAHFAWQEVWLPAIILIMCTGFVEELMFRGVLQHSAVRSFGKMGIVYVSLLFAVLHIGFLSWIDVAFVFFVALYFAWVVNKTNSILGVGLSHGIANTVLYLVMPFFY
jgi:uncharacterized protein